MLAFVAGHADTWLQVALLVLAVPVFIALMVALYALYAPMLAVMYCLWRDPRGTRQEPDRGRCADRLTTAGDVSVPMRRLRALPLLSTAPAPGRRS